MTQTNAPFLEKPLKQDATNENNYFKLRDFMKALDVYMGFNEEKNIIIVNTSKGY